MILAGDIGGSKTVLALFEQDAGGFRCVERRVFPSQGFAEFGHVLDAFLAADARVTAACLGVAGPVVGQRCQTTNLPWLVDAQTLQRRLGGAPVRLLNDLEAMALGMLALPEHELVALNPDACAQAGNIAVIAAGTGLGEAILHWDGGRHLPIATEGGHCDFAPQTLQQDRLLGYLRQHYPGHVSYERILSGPGFGLLYDFLCASGHAPACPAVPAASDAQVDRNAVISDLGVRQQHPLCVEAVRLFVEIYGAEAGNLALKSLALGGVFIGGGIAPKIAPALSNGLFLDAFTRKGRLSPLLRTVPVRLSLNPDTPLLGASRYWLADGPGRAWPA